MGRSAQGSTADPTAAVNQFTEKQLAAQAAAAPQVVYVMQQPQAGPSVEETKAAKKAAYDALPFVGHFRVLIGKHTEGGVTYGKGCPGGSIVHSKTNLSAHNAVGMQPKFQRVNRRDDAKPAAKAAPKDDLESQDVLELLGIADSLGIDLEGRTEEADKAYIIGKIREASAE